MATAHEATASADRIADALEARRDELVAAAFDAIRARLPVLPRRRARIRRRRRRAHPGAPRPALRVLRRGRPAEARELAFVERHAARRARAGHPARRLPRGVPQLPQHRLGRGARDRAAEPRRRPTQALAATRTVIGYVDLAATERAPRTSRRSSCCSPTATASAATCSRTCSPGATPRRPPAWPRRATPASTRTRAACSSPRCRPPRRTTTARCRGRPTRSRRRVARPARSARSR